jgi:hypothetical protein
MQFIDLEKLEDAGSIKTDLLSPEADRPGSLSPRNLPDRKSKC